MSPRIAAVICTYNRYDVLPKAIGKLTEQTLAAEKYRIMVIDNSPDREYAEKVRSQYQSNSQIEYILEPIPGLSNARNVSAQQCGTEFIAYMDDDAIAFPTWLENVLTAFDLFGEDAAIVGGRVDPIWEVERPSWLDDSLLGYVSAVNWGRRNWRAARGRMVSRNEYLISHPRYSRCGWVRYHFGTKRWRCGADEQRRNRSVK